MFTLKEYQKDALKALEKYLKQARLRGPAEAFARVARKPDSGGAPVWRPRWGLDDVPSACLRIPTGGGKTLLAAHAIPLVASCFPDRPPPCVLWLVPTSAILRQTVAALKNHAHPCREALDAAFNVQGVEVFEIGDAASIRPADILERACVVVSTMQGLRVRDRDARRIYGHNEAFEPHFGRLRAAGADLDRADLDRAGDGSPILSFVNLLHLIRPVVVVDEAHRMLSELSAEVMRRINPSCVLEFTATPAEGDVLLRVPPSALRAEEMIRLPINVAEHADWREAALSAMRVRGELEELAVSAGDPIRPLALFQAQKKGGECTVDVLRAFLVEQGGAPEEAVAVATGERRGLDGVDLLAPGCPIRHVITVEALKEGWDCPYAYVFCSAANISSGVDVEQLLGRVMRMPHARARKHPRLNMAYAHVVAPAFAAAAQAMHDCMRGMGFDDREAAEAIRRPEQPSLLPTGWRDTPLGRAAGGTAPPPLVLSLEKRPDLSGLPEDDVRGVEIRGTADGGLELRSTAPLSREAADRILACVPEQARAEARRAAARHAAEIAAAEPEPPSRRGVALTLPRLVVDLDGAALPADADVVAMDWSPLKALAPGEPALPPERFSPDPVTRFFQFDLDGERMVWRRADDPFSLVRAAAVGGMHDESALARDLDRLCRREDVDGAVMLEFCRRCVADLTAAGTGVGELFSARMPLAEVVRRRIAELRERARKAGFRELFLLPGAPVRVDRGTPFAFPPEGYAETIPAYSGAYVFQKHYYGRPRDLRSDGEEFRCAQRLDRHPKVKVWARNVDRQKGSFFLPTSGDNFYPDFIGELEDGRPLVAEYKGRHLLSNDDTKEKLAIGERWAELGGGVFLLISEGGGEFDPDVQLARLGAAA